MQANDTPQSYEASYIQSLTPKEHKAYLIAKSHLGSSFDLEKSIGFGRYKQEQTLNIDRSREEPSKECKQ